MSGAGSEQGSRQLDDWRYELKLVCEERAHAAVLTELRGLEAGIRVQHPERIVQSIYFDTHESRAVQDNLAGSSERQKLRLRWYGEAQEEIHGQLELKLRRNQLGRKETWKAPEAIQVGGVDRLRFMRRLIDHSPEPWRSKLAAGLEPVQWIRYRRQYFSSFDRRLRITVDRELAACDLRDRWKLAWARPSYLPRMLIVECKAPAARESELRELVSQLRLQVGRCSKFVLASSAGHGPLASMRGF